MAELVKQAAWDLRSARVRIEQLEAKVASLEAEASSRKDPYELGKAVLASAHRMADEQRETARHESELVLKKAEGRAVRIELDAQRRLDDGISQLEQLEAFRVELSGRLRSTLEAIVALSGDKA